jgi:hypothetical protein
MAIAFSLWRTKVRAPIQEKRRSGRLSRTPQMAMRMAIVRLRRSGFD